MIDLQSAIASGVVAACDPRTLLRARGRWFRTQSEIVSEDGVVRLHPSVEIESRDLRSFAERHAVQRLALFGSILRPDFDDDSDIDLLVEFEQGRTPGLLRLAAMELELGELLGREVDLRTVNDLSPYFRDEVAAGARELYAA